MIDSRKPYRAKNLILKNLNINNEDVIDIESGFLKISVFQEKNDEPLEYALVRISRVAISGLYDEKADGRLIIQYLTDEEGDVPNTRLHALNELDSENNDFYIVAVHAEGYYSAYAFNIQIYPNVTTSYKINLSEVSAGEDKFNFIMQPRRIQI